MIFRIVAVFLGLTFGFFSYKIFVLTKGSVKGWTYLTWTGLVLSAWAVLQTVLTDNPLVVDVSSFVGFLAIGVLLPLAFIKLDKSFGITLHKFFSKNVMLTIYGSLWAILLVLNFFILEFSNIMSELAGISHFLLSIMAIYAIYPSYKMWRQTGKWFWMLMFVFIVCIGVAVMLGAYASAACYEKPDDFEACEGFSAVYPEVVPLPYISGLIAVTSKYHVILITGMVLGAIGLYGLWRQLKI